MNKALFLDRDGVVNIEKNYVHKSEDFEFMGGILDLCARFQRDGFLIVVATNQAGIARGLYPLEDLLSLNAWMTDRFADQGVRLAKVYYCPHHPDFTGDCPCRKPHPGMIIQAKEELDLDLSESVLLGDKESDLEAGRRAGVGWIGLVSGRTAIESILFDGGLPSLRPEDLPEKISDLPRYQLG